MEKDIKRFLVIITLCVMIGFSLLPGNALADEKDSKDDHPWTIYFRPGVRFGTDNRTLYIMDFLVPIYQGEKNILFVTPKFTPNDHDSWEMNLGLGYRHLLFNDSLILGINGFYDQRKTPWGSYHEQWGIGAEIMAEIPLKSMDLGLTGRVNYYHPITSPIIDLGPNGGYIHQGGGVYVLDVANLWLEEPLGGVDAEIGFRVPFVSDYVETWLYAGGYHFEGKYVDDIDGFSARIEVNPTDFLKLNYEFRSDRTAHEQHYGEVTVNIPFSIDNLIAGKNPFEGLGDMLSGSRELEDRLTDPVRRDVDVVVIPLAGFDAADALGMPFIYYVKGPEEIDIISKLNSKIKGDTIIFVSEKASEEEGGDGSIEHPYPSIDDAMDDERIKDGVSNTICVLNDNDDRFDGSPGTFAGGGLVNYVGMLILGTGIDLTELEIFREIALTDGYPTIGSTISIAAPEVSIAGLEFKIRDEESAIVICTYPRLGNITAMNDIIIFKNIIEVQNHNDSAYGIKTFWGTSPFDPYPNMHLGSEDEPLLIIENDISLFTDDGTIAGIYLRNRRNKSINTIILNNDITLRNFNINDSDLDTAYGIRLETKRYVDLFNNDESDISVDIVNNNIVMGAFGNGHSVPLVVDEAYGISIWNQQGDIGLFAIKNTIDITNERGQEGSSLELGLIL